MKLIIAGTRTFNNYKLLKTRVEQFLSAHPHIQVEIISGCANGADKLGEQFAKEHNYRIDKHPAEWDEYGKSAGYIRNEVMAIKGTHCIVFWDGYSRGTESMINLAKKYNLKLQVVKYE